MHGQPLLLFEPSTLTAQAEKWPKFLLELMEIVTARWQHAIGSDVPLRRLVALPEIRREVMLLATQGKINVHVLQALCLLVLEDISGMCSVTC